MSRFFPSFAKSLHDVEDGSAIQVREVIVGRHPRLSAPGAQAMRLSMAKHEAASCDWSIWGQCSVLGLAPAPGAMLLQGWSYHLSIRIHEASSE
jgi:hypothetical protein